jgi:anti-sigma factor RsiW
MNLERFAELVAAYGTDPGRWPAAERRAVGSLLAASTEAQQLVREAEAFDALLAAPLPAIEPSAALRSRIMAQAMPQPKQPGWRIQIAEAFGLLFPSGRMVPQLAALTLALAIGIGAGFTNILPVDTQDNDLVTLQLSSAVPIDLEE